jgi:hypothetical protein
VPALLVKETDMPDDEMVTLPIRPWWSYAVANALHWAGIGALVGLVLTGWAWVRWR